MRVGRNRPGASTDFIDSSRDEALLRIACGVNGEPLIAFRLYDSRGQLIAETDDFRPFPAGIRITAPDGDVLLDVPAELGDEIRYCLYNSEGRLLTCSDGQRTQLFAFLRMEKGHI